MNSGIGNQKGTKREPKKGNQKWEGKGRQHSFGHIVMEKQLHKVAISSPKNESVRLDIVF
jgi:hypothetical protein